MEGIPFLYSFCVSPSNQVSLSMSSPYTRQWFMYKLKLKLKLLPCVAIPYSQFDKLKLFEGRSGIYTIYSKTEDKWYVGSADNVLTISLERALELLSEPKKGRAANSKSKAALRELGTHPEDDTPVNIYDGPYGPYIKHGKINVSIPEGETVENITFATALTLLASKKSTAKSTRKTTKSTTSKSKSTTKSGKTVAKKNESES